MTDADNGPASKGKRFPFIDLEKALDRAAKLYEADRNGRPMQVSVAFDVWEYSGKSSGGHQTVAALKSYGIIDADKAQDAKRINLSQNALRYFKEERDDEKARLRKLFALRPALLAGLWQHWRDSPPSDNVARSFLKIDLGLGEQQARALLGIYKENLTFAELKGGDKVVEKDTDADEDDAAVIAPTPPPSKGESSETKARIPAKIGMKEDTFNLDEGEVVLQWPEQLSQASYEDLESWMNLQLRKIKRRVVGGSNTN